MFSVGADEPGAVKTHMGRAIAYMWPVLRCLHFSSPWNWFKMYSTIHPACKSDHEWELRVTNAALFLKLSVINIQKLRYKVRDLLFETQHCHVHTVLSDMTRWPMSRLICPLADITEPILHNSCRKSASCFNSALKRLETWQCSKIAVFVTEIHNTPPHQSFNRLISLFDRKGCRRVKLSTSWHSGWVLPQYISGIYVLQVAENIHMTLLFSG